MKVSHQGVEVDVLHRECVVVVAVELATAFGATDPDPVWRLAAGAPVATDLDEGLDEDNRHGAIRCPVGDPGYLLGDRSFDHDNDTEREDGIHRMDAHIVADEETVKAADDPHMLDFRP